MYKNTNESDVSRSLKNLLIASTTQTVELTADAFEAHFKNHELLPRT